MRTVESAAVTPQPIDRPIVAPRGSGAEPIAESVASFAVVNPGQAIGQSAFRTRSWLVQPLLAATASADFRQPTACLRLVVNEPRWAPVLSRVERQRTAPEPRANAPCWPSRYRARVDSAYKGRPQVMRPCQMRCAVLARLPEQCERLDRAAVIPRSPFHVP